MKVAGALFALLVTACAVAGDVDSEGDTKAKVSYDADAFAVCASCHMQTGEGLAGAFPPVRNRASAIAKLPGGREYLISAVAYGLMGQIQVDGQMYFGVMAGHTGMLKPQGIADAINYMVFELNDDVSAAEGVDPFDGSQVEAFQSVQESPDFNTTAKMRAELVEKHGDLWP